MKLRTLASLRRARREVWPTTKLALPIMAGMVSQMLMGLIDTLMVGRVGVVPLAASAFVIALVVVQCENVCAIQLRLSSTTPWRV